MQEPFEYYTRPEEPVPPQPPRSPYADSPYEIQYQPPYQPPKKEKKKSNAGKVVLCILLSIAVILVSSCVTALLVSRQYREQNALLREAFNSRVDVLQSQLDAMQSQAASGFQVPAEGMTPGQVYAQNVRAVVAVSCYVQNQYETYQSFGSGFIVSEDGYVVSNCHVVEGATDIRIQTADGEEYPAQLLGVDDTNDVSLLKIQGEGFPCVKIGSSDALVVGDQVMAIGNPLGELTSTLTVGYVSAKDRVVTTDGTTINMLQTDAAINSGNSGGPLFNSRGEVVGITTAKYSGTSASGATIEGIGFAIPIDDVLGILEDLHAYGYVKTSYLGIYCREVSADAIGYGLPAGVYVEDVTAGYSAEAAGLRKGDIITELGGYKVASMADLTRALRKVTPSEETTITVYRSGQEMTLRITLDEKPAEQPVQQPEQSPQEEMPEQWYSYPDIFGDIFGDFFGNFFG